MLNLHIPSKWLTSRRVLMHGFLLALCLWAVYAANMTAPGLRDRSGHLKGTDFVQFYNLGSLTLHGRGDLLYNLPALNAWMHRLVPDSAGMIYAPFYGPQISLLFEPFARMPYGWALAAWLLLNVFLYGACCYLVWKTCLNLSRHKLAIIVLAFAFPGFFHLITFGQTSGILLLCLTVGYLALRADWKFVAGLAIGTLIFKPQFGLAAAVVFLAAREWKIVSGAIVAAVAQLAAAAWHYGWPIIPRYVQTLSHSAGQPALLEPRLYQTFSLRGFWILLAGFSVLSFALYIFTALLVLVGAVWIWRSPQSLSMRYSGLLLATVLAAPHCNVYDLVILAPAFLLLGDWVLGHADSAAAGNVRVLLYVLYLLFLLEPLAKFTHVQLGVLGLGALFWINFEIAKTADVATAASAPA